MADFKEVIHLDLKSDPSEALNALKKITNQLKELSANPGTFKGMDKDLDNLSKMLLEFKNRSDAGFRNTKDIKEMTSLVEKIQDKFFKVNAALINIQKNEQGTFEFKQIQEARKEIGKLEDSLKGYQNSLVTSQKSLKEGLKGLVGSDLAKSWAKEIKSQEDLNKKLEKILKERVDAYEIAKAQMTAKNASLVAKGGFNASKFVKTENIDNYKTGQVQQAKNIIKTAADNGALAGEDFSKVWERIKENLDKAGISLNNLGEIENEIQIKFEALVEKIGTISPELKNARAELLKIAEETENGEWKLNEDVIPTFSGEEAVQNIDRVTGKIAEQSKVLEDEKQISKESLGALNEGMEDASKKTKEASESLGDFADEGRQAAESFTALERGVNNLKTTVTTLFSLGTALREARKIIMETFEDVKKLDAAYASIAMVTDKTVAQLWDTYGEYASMANKLGQSTESVIKSSALFYQQGLDTAEALSLTEDTMKLATLAGADFETATQQMTAALRGFHMEMDQGAHVTDVYSELAAHAAADVNGIAYAMSKTASIANSAGMSFENTSAFLANMIETTQEAPKQK